MVSSGDLTQLHLKNCPQLTELDCYGNKLTELTITNCPNLQIIYAYGSQINNNLNIFSHLTKLKKLDLGCHCGKVSAKHNFFRAILINIQILCGFVIE